MTGLAGDAARHAGPDLRIEDGRIAAIGRLDPRPGEAVIDCRDCVIYPGWVNTHHHLFQSLLKGVPAGMGLPLVPWLSAVPVAYRRFVDEDMLRTAARIGIAELVLAGCTTVADHHYAYWPGMGFDASALLFDVASEFGVRFVLLRGFATQVRAVDIDPPPQAMPEPLDSVLTSVERDVQRFHQTGGAAMRKLVLAPTTTPTWSVPADQLVPLARAARRLGIGLHSHLSESLDYVRYCQHRARLSAGRVLRPPRMAGPGRLLRPPGAPAGHECGGCQQRHRHVPLPAEQLPAGLGHRTRAGAGGARRASLDRCRRRGQQRSRRHDQRGPRRLARAPRARWGGGNAGRGRGALGQRWWRRRAGPERGRPHRARPAGRPGGLRTGRTALCRPA
jgi:hypothetical protein